MNRFTKIIEYLFMKIIINVTILTKIFYNKIMYYYNILNDIVNDRDFIFINYFYLKIKRRLNIVFHL